MYFHRRGVGKSRYYFSLLSSLNYLIYLCLAWSKDTNKEAFKNV